MSTYDVNLPTKCSLCGIGELEQAEDAAMILYDAKTGVLDIRSMDDIGIIPVHTLICNHCGYLVLLSATKVQM